MLQLGTLLALACALATNVAMLCKHRGAVAAPGVELRQPAAERGGAVSLPLVDDRVRDRGRRLGAARRGAGRGPAVAGRDDDLGRPGAARLAGRALVRRRVGRREWLGLGLCAVGPRAAGRDLRQARRAERRLLDRGDDLVRGRRGRDRPAAAAVTAARAPCDGSSGALLGVAPGCCSESPTSP